MFIFLASGCSGPTPRKLEVDTEQQGRVLGLKPRERPRIIEASNPHPPTERTLDEFARDLASAQELLRIQADGHLRKAGSAGVEACLRAIAAGQKRETAASLAFLAQLDFDALSGDLQSEVRRAAVRGLSDSDAQVRIAAAQMLAQHGAADWRTDFLTALADSERKVRWAVRRRFGEHPQELERAQLLLIVSFLGDAKLESAVRADAYSVLLAAHDRLSKGQRPASYDPYAKPQTQAAAIAKWQAWAKKR